MKKASRLLLSIALLLAISIHVSGQSSGEIYEQIEKLKTSGTVLYIAAHPDDENTRLITWLSKEKKFRTAYLSLTRGDGGQNLIGSELGIDLGLIRTRELMAARAIDGGEQFFSRAYDFGFSKTPDETLTLWEREKVLEDIVTVIRNIQPDIIICRFPPDSRAGHGHHSSSAILAAEAFKAAADPKRFQSNLSNPITWSARRIYWNTFNFGNNNTTSEQQLKIDVGAFNPILGKSYGELSAESRSQHKSQGFGVPSQRGTQTEYFLPVDGDTLVKDLFESMSNYLATSSKYGHDTEIKIDSILKNFDFNNPSSSVPALLQLKKMFTKLPGYSPTFRKVQELDKIILQCMGVWVAAYSFQEGYATGDTLHVNFQAICRNYTGVQLEISNTGLISGDTNSVLEIQKNFNRKLILTARTKTTQPYWLEAPIKHNLFDVKDLSQNTLPWSPPAGYINYRISVDGTLIESKVPVTFKLTDPVRGELFRPLVIKPVLTGHLSEHISLFSSSEARTYKLKIQHNGASTDSFLISAVMPSSKHWKTTFRDTLLVFNGKEEKTILYKVIATGNGIFQDTILFHYRQFQEAVKSELTGLKEISYDHIPKITWFPPLQSRLISAPVKTVNKKILYIKGAGDEVADMLRQLNIEVKEVTAAEIENINLEMYDAIVSGIRAYNTDQNLPAVFPKIMDYIQQGGSFIVQYNTNSNLHPVKFMAPFPYQISRNRVTEEQATVTFTQPEHPVFNYPNKITEQDFEGWIQERGLYFATKADSSYINLLLMNDKGEQPQEGSMIYCNYGKGKYIYTGLSFFRQLPAGVPGAFKLFSNLLAPRTDNKASGK